MLETPCDRWLALGRRSIQQSGKQTSCPQQHHGRARSRLDEIVQTCPQIVIPGRQGQDHPDRAGIVGYFSGVKVPGYERDEDALHGVEYLHGGGRIVDRRRQSSQADVGQEPECEQRILVESAFLPYYQPTQEGRVSRVATAQIGNRVTLLEGVAYAHLRAR